MNIGDHVQISYSNPNHLGYGVSAYAGMSGVVTDIWDDGGFAFNTGSAWLVATKPIKIWLNGKEVHYGHIGFWNSIKTYITLKFKIK